MSDSAQDLTDEAAAPVTTYTASSSDNKWNKNGFGENVIKRTGKFSKEESETVRKAVEEYCAQKNISVSRLCSECDHKAELKGAWMEIAKRLPHRSVQSVYRRGLRQLHPFKRGAWTEEECDFLVRLVQQYGKKWRKKIYSKRLNHCRLGDQLSTQQNLNWCWVAPLGLPNVQKVHFLAVCKIPSDKRAILIFMAY